MHLTLTFTSFSHLNIRYFFLNETKRKSIIRMDKDYFLKNYAIIPDPNNSSFSYHATNCPGVIED